MLPSIIIIYVFRGRVNHTIRQRSHSGSSISLRDPKLPIKSLPGPPVPPRAYSQININMAQDQGRKKINIHIDKKIHQIFI